MRSAALLTSAAALVARPTPRHPPLKRGSTAENTDYAATLSQHTALAPFAAHVERELVQRFGARETERVRQSWRLADAGYVHFDQIVPGHEYMKQEARSYVPGLNPVAFWDTSSMAWARTLEESWEVVRDEFERVALQDAKRTKRVGNNVWAGAADSDSAQKYGQDWKTLVLMDRTTWDPVNSKLFPRTAKLLADAEAPIVEAFFAAMTPRSRINPHTDSCNFILTSHLGLRIPEGCSLTVGDETRTWTEGGVMLFDTSLYHDAANDSDDTRYILMLRTWHPELSDVERKALQFLFDVLDVPDLISSDPVAQFRAEHELAGLRTRPEVRARAAPPDALEPRPKQPGNKKKKKKKQARARAGGFGVST